MRPDEVVLQRATFNPKVRDYWLLSGAVLLITTCVFSPLVIVWFLVGRAITQRYLDRMSCVLTERTLKVSKGLFVRVEKTVPLDKITDLGMVQGPIMRIFDVEALSIETAGSSGAGASLVQLAGIEGAREFRDAVLEQRDRITLEGPSARPLAAGAPAPGAESSAPQAKDHALLSEIRDGLGRIEALMRERRES
jgi:membrane protein YdbS with pleckstrin-like domain